MSALCASGEPDVKPNTGQLIIDGLDEIASAMGVKGATRLRKADLIEAILAKATGGAAEIPEPSGDRPKKSRTVKKKAAGDTPEKKVKKIEIMQVKAAQRSA